jgi:ribonuclease G
VNCHPEVARILQGAEREELRYLMDRFNKTIQVKPQSGYHQEQFDIYGRQERVDQPRERERGRGRDRDRGGRGRAEEPAPATPPADASGGEER